MADASFDAAVIGGGHQGLIAANYMAKNGTTVGLFEQRRELGGGAATEARPASGFPRIRLVSSSYQRAD